MIFAWLTRRRKVYEQKRLSTIMIQPGYGWNAVPPGTYVTIFNIPNFEGMTGIIEKVLQNERGYDVRIMSVEHYGCTIFCTDADITSPTMKE